MFLDWIVLIGFLYFYLYKRNFKKVTGDPQKSVWVKWLGCPSGKKSFVEYLFPKMKRSLVPLLKCILIGGLIKALLIPLTMKMTFDFKDAFLDPDYMTERENYMLMHAGVHLSFFAPTWMPIFYYRNQHLKNNPEEMFYYNFKKEAELCEASRYRSYLDCQYVLLTLKRANKIDVFYQLTINIFFKDDDDFLRCVAFDDALFLLLTLRDDSKTLQHLNLGCEQGCPNACEKYEKFQESGGGWNASYSGSSHEAPAYDSPPDDFDYKLKQDLLD